VDEWIWTLGLGPAFAQFAPMAQHPPPLPEAGDGVPTKIGYRTIDGIRIRCAECGGEAAAQSILMTSPWPESMFAFAPIWSALARRFRVHAMDLPGFGGSGGTDALRSPRAMGAFLARLIGDGEFGEVHLVAPDVGTAAGLFAAALRPANLVSVVVGSGAAAVPVTLSGPLAEWVSAPDLEPYRAMDPRAIVGAALDTIGGAGLPTDIREDHLASYDGDRFVESMRYVRRYPEELPELAERLPEIGTPVQIIAGRRDRVVPLANAEFLHERLPHSRLAVLDAGHFVWEEAAARYGSIVERWALGGHREA
jgi:pimeloyl-ACP methyl ester carboxylesterase